MSDNIVDEVYEEIRKRNLKVGEKSIPHSDELIRTLSGSLVIPENLVQQIINILVAAKRIFLFEIVAEDQMRETPRIEGFVVSDLTILRKINSFFQSELVSMYNTEFNKHLMFHKIVKEIFPIIRSLNNTPIGQIANKAIMLGEFEKLMERNYKEYLDDNTRQKLNVELSKANLKIPSDDKKEKDKSAPPERRPEDAWLDANEDPGKLRAMDGEVYQDFISKSNNYPLQRILNIYGVKFFFQIYLRKCDFNYIKLIIKDKQISKRSDLILLKDMLRKVKLNINDDPDLKEHIEEIYELERTISHSIYFSEKGAGSRFDDR